MYIKRDITGKRDVCPSFLDFSLSACVYDELKTFALSDTDTLRSYLLDIGQVCFSRIFQVRRIISMNRTHIVCTVLYSLKRTTYLQEMTFKTTKPNY